MDTISISTEKKNEVIDITEDVERIVSKSRISEGICLVYVPHSTAAITINEDYDKKVCIDLLDAMNKLIPEGIWQHDREDGNGAAHVKSAIIGPSVTIPIKDSKLILGTWQGIMLCEFDGPRDRKIVVICK